MNKLFYPKLAWQNLRNNSKFYFPYILTVIFTAASFYIMLALNGNADNLPERVRYTYLSEFVAIGIFIVGLFSIIFLFYTNSFLMKKRNKEIALYNILGMGKRHIAKVLAFESLYTAVFGIGGGIIVGFVFQKLVAMLLYKMMNFNVYYDFYIFGFGVAATAIVFGAILFINLLFNLFRIHLAKPIELLHSGAAGEKEPKTKWILTILGFAALGIGYYIAVTTQNAVDALTLYFVAVFLVIIGTYCLFTSISIFVLKLLRNNKRLYYKTKNFIGISGMLYRMKRNAVGLANICILSTMVLVMVSGTLSLFLGTEDALNSRYPTDYTVTVWFDPNESTDFNDTMVVQTLDKCINNSGFTADKMDSFRKLSFACGVDGDTYIMDRSKSVPKYEYFCIITADEYTKLTGNKVTGLKSNQVMLYSNTKNSTDTININTKSESNPDGKLFSFDVVRTLDSYPYEEPTNIFDGRYMIVSDKNVMLSLYEEQQKAYSDSSSLMQWMCYIDITGNGEERLEAADIQFDEIWDDDFARNNGYYSISISDKESNTAEFYSLNGGFFFLGVFFGILFIMATVLIIYYKQISEGYEDRERYIIMQKVGMDKTDVKRSINSQILTVFFMPLIVAAIHVTFNFKLVTLLLSLFGLMNTTITFWCTICTVGAFIAVYGVVYMLTAKAYYKIVS